MHLFVSEATIGCALFASLKNDVVAIPRLTAYNDVLYLSRMLKWEFIYKPTHDFTDNFESTFTQMREAGVLYWDKENDLIGVTDAGKSFISFLCFLLWPFIEAYWMCAASLWCLFPNHVTEERNYLINVRQFAMTLYYQGELSFFESISTDMTRMAMTRFRERQVIERKFVNDRGFVVVHLTEAYQNDEAKLRELVESIGKFRRIGKYSQETNFSPRIRELARMITPRGNVSKM